MNYYLAILKGNTPYDIPFYRLVRARNEYHALQLAKEYMRNTYANQGEDFTIHIESTIE